jgi:hypothetical protein
MKRRKAAAPARRAKRMRRSIFLADDSLGFC